MMANIYEPLSAEGFELCQPVCQDDYETISTEINGAPRSQAWRPIAMRLVHMDEGKKLTTSDAPWLGSDALIFRKPAVDKLGGLLNAYGELLPINCSEAELWFFNPTKVVD